MKKWAIPSRIVEYRNVIVEASTKEAALRLYRQRVWLDCDDADDSRAEVYKVGPVTERT
jgi:hypothetical protein